jgi:hypothetical protein
MEKSKNVSEEFTDLPKPLTADGIALCHFMAKLSKGA